MNYGAIAAAGIGATLTFAMGYIIGLRLGWLAGFKAGADTAIAVRARKKR